jgi:hypothetical protein
MVNPKVKRVWKRESENKTKKKQIYLMIGGKMWTVSGDGWKE